MNKGILSEDINQFVTDFPFHQELKCKTFLITGATGLLGSIMVKCLMELSNRLGLNIKLICPVRDCHKAKTVLGEYYNQVEVIQTELESIQKTDFSRQIDFIIHFAAPTASHFFVEHPVETMCAVFDGTHTLLEIARENNIKGFAYISSLEVYGTILDDTQAITEDIQGYIDPMSVRSSYSLSKRAAECLCHSYAMEYNIPVSIARLAQTFGAGIAADDNRVFAQFAKSVVNKTDIELHTTGELCRVYCYTIDAISGILYILLHGERGKSYNIANDNTYISIRDMAELMRQFSPDIDVFIRPSEGHGYSPVTKLRLDTTAIRKLGWIPKYDLTEMYGRLIKYLE